ncbi:MAG TPA: zinc ribbon domain-containing protein [Candidatus Omnitrophota bacterium]|nr:zinc ribbon domain-containing protein [Candidatus Omnitrophota bacterium]HPS19483.1 zinc ribbon domain-containing protein [Candidatus Omnitrophota bacterium]
MPTYEYKCEKCDHVFEKFQKMTDEPVKECPKCKSPVKKVINPGAGIILKGSGFYQTDYKNPSSGKSPCGKDTPCSSCGLD